MIMALIDPLRVLSLKGMGLQNILTSNFREVKAIMLIYKSIGDLNSPFRVCSLRWLIIQKKEISLKAKFKKE